MQAKMELIDSVLQNISRKRFGFVRKHSQLTCELLSRCVIEKNVRSVPDWASDLTGRRLITDKA